MTMSGGGWMPRTWAIARTTESISMSGSGLMPTAPSMIRQRVRLQPGRVRPRVSTTCPVVRGAASAASGVAGGVPLPECAVLTKLLLLSPWENGGLGV